MDSYGLALAADKDLKVEYDRYPEEMLPGIAVNRKNEDGKELETTFISVYEPYINGTEFVSEVKRLVVEGEADNNKGAAAFMVATRYGTDLILAADIQNKGIMVQKDWNVKTDASLCVLRKTMDGKKKLIMMQGSFFEADGKVLSLDKAHNVFEAEL